MDSPDAKASLKLARAVSAARVQKATAAEAFLAASKAKRVGRSRRGSKFSKASTDDGVGEGPTLDDAQIGVLQRSRGRRGSIVGQAKVNDDKVIRKGMQKLTRMMLSGRRMSSVDIHGESTVDITKAILTRTKTDCIPKRPDTTDDRLDNIGQSAADLAAPELPLPLSHLEPPPNIEYSTVPVGAAGELLRKLQEQEAVLLEKLHKLAPRAKLERREGDLYPRQSLHPAGMCDSTATRL